MRLAIVMMLALARTGAADPMTGPYPTLRAFCEHEVADDPELTIDACPSSHAGGAAIAELGVHLRAPIWFAAIETRDGWYVADLPVCSGRGCEPFATGIERRAAHGGPAVVAFAGGWTQPVRDGDAVHAMEEHVELVCVPGPRPACATVVRRISIDGDDDDLRVDVRLHVAARWRRGALELVLTGRHRVTGTTDEAARWRAEVADALGRHVLAMR